MPPRSEDDLPRSEDYYDSPSSSGSTIGIVEILLSLRRDWLFPVVGCLIGLLAALAYIATAPALYKSNARILVDMSVNRYLQTNKIIDEPIFDQAELASQIHILSSESIIIPVVRQLDLVHDKEFVGTPNTFVSRMLRNIKESVGWSADARMGETIDRDAILERIAIEAFYKRLSVYREDVANVINVTFGSSDPNKAARIANTIAETYVAANQKGKSRSTKIASQLLQDRLMELKVQAMEADRALQNYKAAHNLANSEKDLPIAEQQISSISAELTKARLAAAEAKSRLDRIRQNGSVADTAILPESSSDSLIVKLRSQYMDLAEKLAEINTRVEPGHEALVKIQKRMGEVRVSIRTEAERLATSEYQNAKVRETELAATVDRMLAESTTKGHAQVAMRDLESSSETLRNQYASLLQKFQDINVSQSQSSGIQDVSIVTRAAPPLHKASNKGLLVLAMSLAGGLFLGVGAAIGKEWIAEVFRTPEAVMRATGIHCVVLPVTPNGSTRAALREGGSSGIIEEITIDEPYSRFTETLRSVKALINAHAVGGGGKVVGVVSSVAKEGKTTIAANLGALMIASPGPSARVLIIDGDLHLRRLTARLAPDAQEGLMEALADPSRLPALVRRRQHSGLDVLPCVLSARLPNAAELLGSPQMERLLIAARNAYDFIIIEVPPIMSVVDIQVVERFIDRFIFVVEWGQTKRRLVLEALSEAEVIRGRIVSLVLNKADPSALRSIEAYKGARFKDYYEG